MNEEEIKKAQLEVQTLWAEMKKALEKEAEERKTLGASRGETEDKITKLNAKIDELELKMSRPAVGTEVKTIEPTLEMKAYEKFLRNKTLTVEETKVLSEVNDVEGGYLAPKEVSKSILAGITEVSQLRKICNVITIGAKALDITKDSTVYPSYWEDEVEVNQVGNFGMETIPAHSQRKTIIVTPALMEDSVVNLDTYLRGKLVEAFAIKEGTAFVSGNGISRPEGFLLDADLIASHVHSGAATTIGVNSLITLSFAPKEGYLPNSTFVMNRNTLLAIRLLVKVPFAGATAGDYVWQPGYGNLPSTILGYPYILVSDMPDIAAGTYPVAFGDFKAGYTIVDRLGVTIQKLIELYAPNIGFLARMRVGGQVVMSEAIKLMFIAV
jgi:HK97 family phage major capsid protein